MTTNTKTHVEPKTAISLEEEVTPTGTSTTSYTYWVRQVVEAMLEGEQKWLELAAEQNELTLKALKQGVEFFRTVPAPRITEWARNGEERFMAAQRRWIDSTTRQRERMLQEIEKAEKEVEGTPTPNYRNVTYVAREQVEGLVEARNRWLDFLTKQNDLFIQSIQETLGVKETIPAANRAKLVEETVDNYVEVQKRLLKIVTPPTPITKPKTADHPKAEAKTADHHPKAEAKTADNHPKAEAKTADHHPKAEAKTADHPKAEAKTADHPKAEAKTADHPKAETKTSQAS